MYSYADRVKNLRVEFDGRHPKVRMTLIAYLADAGYTPDKAANMTAYIDSMEQLIDFITADGEAFYTHLESLVEEDDDPTALTEAELPERKRPVRDGGPYL